MHVNIKVSILVGVATSIAFVLGIGASSAFNSMAVYNAQKLAKDTINACDNFNASHDLSFVELKLSFYELIKKREELGSEGWESLEEFSREMVERERLDVLRKIKEDESDEYIIQAKKTLEKIDKSLIEVGL